ncbi:TonB-dependent receptor [Flagellimonas sp.]|uniref:TonB-dependent receptor n=1 Tax=Flagellimonas sp. TaxID=2058762 RepID=UPI003B505BC6
MKKNIISLWLMLTICGLSTAQKHSVQIKVLTEQEQEPLLGATVYLANLSVGATTNFDGVAILENLETGDYELTISYLGFETINSIITVPSENQMVFYLKESTNALEEVVLQSLRSTRTIQKIPTRIEYIGLEELGEKVAMNPANISMVLRESTGIQMQQTSLSSGNTNIRIQGLDGRYTQLLRDGFPLYGGFSSGLSILQIPPLDLRQFEIIKGSSSTLYGGGAIAGLVNLVSKVPEEEPQLDLMLTQTHAGGSTGNIFYGEKKGKMGWTIYGSAHYQKVYDPEDDGFSNLPETTTFSLNPKLFFYPSNKTSFWFGINGTLDNRHGGDISRVENGQNGIHQYSEKNNSKRISSQAVFETQLDSSRTFIAKNSISFFDRSLEIPDLTFLGKQWNSFSEISLNNRSKKLDWVFGANLYTTNFNEDSESLERDQKDVTTGIFVNNIYDISNNWILETGLRTDYAKDWGFFALPRISLLYKTDFNFSSRIGGGFGYKIPDIFTEEASLINFNNIIPIDKNALDAERSYGVNLDFNFQTRLSEQIGFSINQLFYLTAIKKGLLLNPIDTQLFQFVNADGNVTSKGAETNIKFTYKDFRWFLNYALIDTRLNFLPGNPQKPLTAKHNIGSVFMFESPKWRIGYETYYTGKQLLSDNTKTVDFVTMGLLAIRNFDWGSIFVNFENFTDRRQSRFSPLVLPPHENPTFPEIYAPTDGIIVSAGLILKPFGNNQNH